MSIRIHHADPLNIGDTVTLGEGAARHLRNALRLQAGAELRLFNGEGREAAARLAVVSKQVVSAEIHSAGPGMAESPLSLSLGIAVSKGERMDWIIQKSTELGVSDIQPLISERVAVKLSPQRWQKKIDHWQQVAISACEQCGRATVPQIAPPARFSDWIRGKDWECKLLLTPGQASLTSTDKPPSRIALLVGPEGGWSDREVSAALDAGFQGLGLGPRVLRTETAPLVALSLLQYAWGDLGAAVEPPLSG